LQYVRVIVYNKQFSQWFVIILILFITIVIYGLSPPDVVVVIVVAFALEEDYCRLPYCRHPLGS
jgi:hypothetical protein